MSADIDARYQSASELLSDLEDFRKQQAAANRANGGGEDEGTSSCWARSRPMCVRLARAASCQGKNTRSGSRRSKKVSILSGACGVLVFMIAVFVFLWNYWLRDIFSVAERINIPNFVGNSYEEIVNSSEFKSCSSSR